jgi:hypothetical protein
MDSPFSIPLGLHTSGAWRKLPGGRMPENLAGVFRIRAVSLQLIEVDHGCPEEAVETRREGGQVAAEEVQQERQCREGRHNQERRNRRQHINAETAGGIALAIAEKRIVGGTS